WLGLMTIDRVTLTSLDTWESLAKKYGTTVASILRQNNLNSGAKVVSGIVVEIPHSDGYGIHGTIFPNSIGTAVSLGCMRMHNSEVEKLFEALPSGRRIPVTINYAPLVERVDTLTGEPYYEVFYDVYRRIKDWSVQLAAFAGRIGAQLSPWAQSIQSQRFNDSILISKSPSIYNNGALIAVGAYQEDGQFFIPASIVEQMLGERYSIFGETHYLGSSMLKPDNVRVVNDMFYINAEIIREHTGKGHYYEPMLNMLQFSTSRLTVDGVIVSYNRVFIHPAQGAMLAISDLTEVLDRDLVYLSQGRVNVGGVTLRGEPLGAFVYMTTSELARLGIRVNWNPQSGELVVVTAPVVTEP
ncbi:MAG: L,D-transpeptidase family protein, partial [Bacillota bacterium]|nr:L,D-transpeptidase family protein [Bacillota bacterium]